MAVGTHPWERGSGGGGGWGWGVGGGGTDRSIIGLPAMLNLGFFVKGPGVFGVGGSGFRIVKRGARTLCARSISRLFKTLNPKLAPCDYTIVEVRSIRIKPQKP